MMDALQLKNMSGIDDVTFMRAWSVQLAQALSFSRAVQGVELFGSLARGRGTMQSDFDVILIVDGFTAARWLALTTELIGNSDPYDGPSSASIRRTNAMLFTGVNTILLENAVGIQPWKLDFFLFPPDWRHRLNELQDLGNHTDPNFMYNIARDAITYVPGQGFPFPVFPR